MLLELSYVCMPTFIATIAIWASYRYFYLDRLSEAYKLIYTVIDVLLIMCLPACFTSADKRQLWVYLCYIFTNISSEAICCCLMLMWCC